MGTGDWLAAGEAVSVASDLDIHRTATILVDRCAEDPIGHAERRAEVLRETASSCAPAGLRAHWLGRPAG